jgi:hypothetical protein
MLYSPVLVPFTVHESKADIAWEDYISAPPGKHECLGRQYISKESPKSFKATVAVVSILAQLSV